MKSIIPFLIFVLLLLSCNDNRVEKPKNLIDEDLMVDILFDISILEAIRVNNPVSLENRGIDPKTYIYSKYKIDSLQFAKSDKFYASDIEKYAKIYDKVIKRIEVAKIATDSLVLKRVKNNAKSRKTPNL